MAIRERKKLGDLLKDAGLVTETQIIEALAKKKPNQKLGDLLVEQGYITETQLLQILEVQLNLKSVSLYTYPIDEALTKLVPKDFARSNLLIPINSKRCQAPNLLSYTRQLLTNRNSSPSHLADLTLTTNYGSPHPAGLAK